MVYMTKFQNLKFPYIWSHEFTIMDHVANLNSVYVFILLCFSLNFGNYLSLYNIRTIPTTA